MTDILHQLTQKDNSLAYAFLQELTAQSEQSDAYYPYLDDFLSLLTDKSAFRRYRGFAAVCAQAKWDAEGRIHAALPRLLALLRDEKPSVIRQCLSLLPALAADRPELRPALIAAVESMDVSGYKDSMQPLILKDMAAALEKL